MSANSPLPTPVSKDWLFCASKILAESGIQTNTLDAELILCHSLNVDRTHLHAHPEKKIDKYIQKKADKMIKMRQNRVPLAYIIGKKEFYGREFLVNESVLIPRPESENIINILKSLNINQYPKLIDVGTGSGCLGITAKLECPNLQVTLIDISSDALRVAKANARFFKAKVEIIESNLLDEYNNKPDIIIANLPYVDSEWETSPETKFEPSQALFADDHGLALIKKLIQKASAIQISGSYMILEADPTQHDRIIDYATNMSYKPHREEDYILSFQKN